MVKLDTIKFNAITEVVNGFSRTENDNFAPDDIVAYIIDTCSPEETLYFISYFTRLAVEQKNDINIEPVKNKQAMQYVINGIKKHNAIVYSSSYGDTNGVKIAASVIKDKKNTLLTKAMIEKGYKNESSYNANEPQPQISEQDVLFARNVKYYVPTLGMLSSKTSIIPINSMGMSR